MKSITSPYGFMAATAACGLKASGKDDLAIIACNKAATTAGVYTKNLVKGHSLQRTMECLAASPFARGIIINAGNANACIGAQGIADAEEMAKQLAFQLEFHPDEVLTGSTGVIGQALDMTKVRNGITDACNRLDISDEAGHLAARAILTTDLVAKEIHTSYLSEGEIVQIAGMAKGSGMIHPNMATMIGVLTSDASIDAELLQSSLRESVEKSFNRCSVDGDTSVCDMVLFMASGQRGQLIDSHEHPDYPAFKQALDYVCTGLARKIAADGEGATKLVDIRVDGAASAEDAYLSALAIAKSPLCKTAFFGQDANWGRIITALGYSGAHFDPLRVDISIGHVAVCKDGLALDFSEAEALKVMKQSEFYVQVNLKQGLFSDHYWTCDFSYDYVKINASYRS